MRTFTDKLTGVLPVLRPGVRGVPLPKVAAHVTGVSSSTEPPAEGEDRNETRCTHTVESVRHPGCRIITVLKTPSTAVGHRPHLSRGRGEECASRILSDPHVCQDLPVCSCSVLQVHFQQASICFFDPTYITNIFGIFRNFRSVGEDVYFIPRCREAHICNKEEKKHSSSSH